MVRCSSVLEIRILAPELVERRFGNDISELAKVELQGRLGAGSPPALELDVLGRNTPPTPCRSRSPRRSGALVGGPIGLRFEPRWRDPDAPIERARHNSDRPAHERAAHEELEV